jgi:hypothetical protein
MVCSKSYLFNHLGTWVFTRFNPPNDPSASTWFELAYEFDPVF